VNLLTCAEAKRQLEAAGFEIVETSKSGVYLPLIAELSGRFGLKLEQWLERRIENSRLDWLLWTQYHLAKA
jgi:hypothetical protein